VETRPKRRSELWFTEEQTRDMRLSLRVDGTLLHAQTPYQELAVLDTPEYGRMIVLDGAIQITERDEFCYSEMMAHVPLCAHPAPASVLIVGGGDGAVLREVLRHPCVERAVLVDIDEQVVEASRRFLPSVAASMDDPRAEVRCTDAIEYIRNAHGEFDVAIVDSTDPVDFAAGLFEAPFYRDLRQALREDGMVIAQTESPFSDASVVKGACDALRRVFPEVRLCWGAMPTYPTGMWTYTVGSSSYDPSVPVRSCPPGTRYYTPDVHRAAFALPAFLSELIR
jgi:spermidine synthase